MRPWLLLVPLLVAATSARAGDAERYAACMDGARAAPREGLAAAEAWLKESGGTAARHCRAVALAGSGQSDAAAAELEQLGKDEEQRNPALAAELYGQAAIIHLEAGRNQAALDLQDRALKLAPQSVELLIDRALAHGATGDYQAALNDLDRARAIQPRRADILVLRASANRLLGHRKRAEQAVEEALALEPDNPDALLERGMLRRLDEDAAGARDDWERARSLAPDSPTAASAEANLKLLDRPAPVGAAPQ